MGLFLGALFGAFFLGAAVFAAMSYRKANKARKNGGAVKYINTLIGAALASVFLVLLIFIPAGFSQVEAGEIAVVKKWGKATGTRTPGLYYRNIVSTKFVKYDLKTQEIKTDFEAYTGDKDSEGKGKPQAVAIQLAVQFRLQADKVVNINSEFGGLEILKSRIDAVGVKGTKEVISTYDAFDLIINRSALSQDVSEKIKDQYNQYYIDVTQILITDIAFTPEFESLIQKTMLAEQEFEKAKVDMARLVAEAENKVKLAEQAAKEKLAKAQGDADALMAMAEAESGKIEMLAKAEAAALKMKSIEWARSIGINILTDIDGVEFIDTADPNIDKLKSFLEYIAYLEKWDGKLPETILGDDISIIIPKP